MAKNPFVTQQAAQDMLTALETALNAGTAAVINGYSGTPPANADAALSGNTLLFQCVCAASIFTSKTDTGTAARGTLAAVTADTSADATGTCTFYRILTQNAGTVVKQGTVGTTDSDLVLNSVAVTAGSQVSVTSGTIDVPE